MEYRWMSSIQFSPDQFLSQYEICTMNCAIQIQYTKYYCLLANKSSTILLILFFIFHFPFLNIKNSISAAMAIIILTNFSFILLCLNLPMAYIYGMEMQQKNAAERHKQMLKRPTTSDLSADATPFYPHFSRNAITTSAVAAEQKPLHSHHESIRHSHIRQFLIENPVRDGDELLPNDPFDMDSPKLEKAHSAGDRSMIDGDIVQDVAQQQQRDDLTAVERAYQQIEVGSRSKWIGEMDVIDKEEAAQKWNTKNNEFVDFHHLQHQNPLQREDLSSNQKQKENIFYLGENEQSKDGSSSERSPKNDVLEKSRGFGEIKFDNLDVSKQQVEFPGLSTLNQIEAVSNMGKTRQKQNILTAVPSKTTYKDKLKDATITKPTTTKTTQKKVPEQVQKGKEKMKEKTEIATKGKGQQSNSIAIPAGVVEHHPSVDGRKKKQGKSPSSSGKSGTASTLLSVRQGNSPPPTKQAYAQGKIMMHQDSPPQTPPDGAVVMHSRDKGDIVMTGANIINPFEALWTAKQDESEVQFKLPNTTTILSGSPSSSSVASGSNKGKAIMTDNDKMIEKEQLKIFYSKIDSIVDLVHKLDQNKSKCMMLIADEHQKDEQVSELMNDYLKIMEEMEEFSANYRKTDEIAYIGDIFNGMNKAYKASVIDNKRLTRIMQESLAYLDENLKSTDIDILDLDDIFKNIDSLKKFTISYEISAKSRGPEDPDTKLAKQEMMEWYENILKGKIREVLSYLFLGLSRSGPDAYAQLTRNMLYMILTMFSQVLPSRQLEFLKARLTVDKYMEIVQGPDNEDQVKTKTDHIVEQYRDQLPKDIQEMNKRIEFVMEKIYELEEEKQKCSETDDYEQRMARKHRLKLNYQFIMVLLTNFVRDYGQKHDKARESDFLVDVLNWMAQLYVAKGIANKFNMTMKYCLQYLQNNEREEDVTKMEKLLQDIAKLKVDAEKCKALAKSTGGYKNPETRAVLHKLHQHFLEVVDPQLREAISYVFIGMRKRDGERVPKGKVALGLIALESVALPEYKDRIDVSNLTITAFNNFWHKALVQEIDENLTEYVAKILGIPFDAEDGGDIDMLMENIQYPSNYETGLAAIDELLKQPEKEDKSINNPTSSLKVAGSKKNKKKAKEKMVETGAITNFGPVNNSNWKKVLNAARKLIRFLNILVNMQQAEENKEKMLFERGIYLRVWTILFRAELASMMDEWEADFYRIKNKDPKKTDVSVRMIVKFYSDGIFNFITHECKGNEAKGKRIREALERLTQLQVQYDMWHRFTHLRNWLNPEEKLVAKSTCDCAGYNHLTIY